MNQLAFFSLRIQRFLKKLIPVTSERKQRQFLDNVFPVFYPSSWNYWTFPRLTYSAANALPNQLLALSSKILADENQKPVTATEFGNGADDRILGQLIDQYGSDKFKHDYTKVYALLFEEIKQQAYPAILEIGLGTNDPDFISSMNGSGIPGASIRAFRDYLPTARIFGADLDEKILFAEERIQTSLVDQTDPSSFDQMWSNFGRPSLNMVIDDGLHSSEANLNTFYFATKALKSGGYMVVEDIPERTIPVWQGLSRMLGNKQGVLVKGTFAYMYVWKKP